MLRGVFEASLIVSGEGRLLGSHPETGDAIRMKRGPYGSYIEMQPQSSGSVNGSKPRRAALPAELSRDCSLEAALELFTWPKVPSHPAILAQLQVLKSWVRSHSYMNAVLQVLGVHPDTGDEVTVALGFYGPYAKCGTVNASLPKVGKWPLPKLPCIENLLHFLAGVELADMQGTDPSDIGLQEALNLIEKKKHAPSRPKQKGSKSASSRKDNQSGSGGKAASKSRAKKARVKDSKAMPGSEEETKKQGKAPNGYLAFGGQRREQLKLDGQKMSPTAIVQQIAAEWRALSETEKEHWKKTAKEAAETSQV